MKFNVWSMNVLRLPLWRRWLLAILRAGVRLSFILMALVAAVFVWWKFNPPDLQPHKEWFLKYIQQISGLVVSVDKIVLQVDWAPEIVLAGVAVRTQADQPAFLQAENALLTFAPSVWWQGGWIPLELVVRQPKVVMQQKATGEVRLGSWVISDPSKHHSEPIILPIHRLLFTEGTLHLLEDTTEDKGEQQRERLRLDHVNLTSNINLAGDWTMAVESNLVVQDHRMPMRFFVSKEEVEDWHFNLSFLAVDPDRLRSFLPSGWLSQVRFPFSLEVAGQYRDRHHWQADWQLAGKKGELDLTPLFRWPMPLISLSGHGKVQESDGLLNVMVQQFALATANGKGSGRFNLTNLGGNQPMIDLQAQVEGESADNAKLYYPAQIMSPDLVHWLDTSIADGVVKKAEVNIKGPLHDIPFIHESYKNSSDVAFHIVGVVEGGSLTYYPGLPPLRQLSTRLIFDRGSMMADVWSAKVAASHVLQGKVTIEDLIHVPEVVVQAKAKAHLSSVWQEIIASSPLRWDEKMHLAGSAWAGEGDMRLDLKLPIHQLDKSQFNVLLALDKAQLHLPKMTMPVSHLTGQLAMSEAKIVLSDWQGILNNKPIELNILAEGYRHPELFQMAMAVKGAFPAEELPKVLELDSQKSAGWFAGEIPLYFVAKHLLGANEWEWEMQSDGKGWSIATPFGWNKAKSMSAKILAKGELDNNGVMELNDLNATMGNIQWTGKAAWQWDKGEVQPIQHALKMVGRWEENNFSTLLKPWLGEMAKVTGEASVVINLTGKQKGGSQLDMRINLDQVVGESVLGWEKQKDKPGYFSLLAQLPGNGTIKMSKTDWKIGNFVGTGGGSWNLKRQEGKLIFSSIKMAKNQCRLEGELGEDNQWHLTCEALDVAPYLTQPKKEKHSPITEMEELSVEQEEAKNSAATVVTLFDVKAKKIYFAQEVEAEDFAVRYWLDGKKRRLETLRFNQGKDKFFKGYGEIVYGKEQGYGAYQGHLQLDSPNFGEVLKGLDWHDGIEGGEGNIRLVLDGEVPQKGALMDHLTGVMRLQINKGVVHKLKLLSQLLGLLSLRELPDLIKGDRPDLAASGFYFDTLAGEFSFADSIMSTDSMVMKGPSLHWLISGRLDLPNKNMAMIVRARPLETLDGIVNKVPLLGALVSGRRQTLYETLWDVTGWLDDPKIALRPVESLSPGVVHDLLGISEKLLKKEDEKPVVKEKEEPNSARDVLPQYENLTPEEKK